MTDLSVVSEQLAAPTEAPTSSNLSERKLELDAPVFVNREAFLGPFPSTNEVPKLSFEALLALNDDSEVPRAPRGRTASDAQLLKPTTLQPLQSSTTLTSEIRNDHQETFPLSNPSIEDDASR